MECVEVVYAYAMKDIKPITVKSEKSKFAKRAQYVKHKNMCTVLWQSKCAEFVF